MKHAILAPWLVLAPAALVAAAEANPLDVRLISETASVAPGETFHLGLHLKHPPEHHSYWKHPGVVGVPTRAKWSLPDGFEAGEIQWPAPETVTMAIYTAQGYHDETLLMIPIHAPAELAAGEITLKVELNWMCCASSCHPAHDVPFSITLPVGDGAPDAATAPLFETHRALVPRPDPAWGQAAARDGETVMLRLSPPADSRASLPTEPAAYRFFTADGQVDSHEPQHVTLDADGTIRFEMASFEFGPEDPKSLPGVLRVAAPEGADLILEIDAPY